MNLSTSLTLSSETSNDIRRFLNPVFAWPMGRGLGLVALVFMGLIGIETRQELHAERVDRITDQNPQVFYERGKALMTEGSPESIQKGLGLLVRSAEKGDSRAVCDLAAYYRWSRPNDVQLARWMRPCAEAHPTADREMVMGQLYLEGRGVSPNAFEAETWYEQAASHGSEESLWALFYMYRDGRNEIRPDKALTLRYAITLMKHVQSNRDAMQFILLGAYEGRSKALAWVCQPTNRPTIETWISSKNLAEVCEQDG